MRVRSGCRELARTIDRDKDNAAKGFSYAQPAPSRRYVGDRLRLYLFLNLLLSSSVLLFVPSLSHSVSASITPENTKTR